MIPFELLILLNSHQGPGSGDGKSHNTSCLVMIKLCAISQQFKRDNQFHLEQQTEHLTN